MLFADCIVQCSTRREQVERKPEEWRRAMEERGLKIGRKRLNNTSIRKNPLRNRKATEGIPGSTLVEDGEL